MEKKKIRQAIALEYDPNDDTAPKVIASGQGALADKIIEKANQPVLMNRAWERVYRHVN